MSRNTATIQTLNVISTVRMALAAGPLSSADLCDLQTALEEHGVADIMSDDMAEEAAALECASLYTRIGMARMGRLAQAAI